MGLLIFVVVVIMIHLVSKYFFDWFLLSSCRFWFDCIDIRGKSLKFAWKGEKVAALELR